MSSEDSARAVADIGDESLLVGQRVAAGIVSDLLEH